MSIQQQQSNGYNTTTAVTVQGQTNLQQHMQAVAARDALAFDGGGGGTASGGGGGSVSARFKKKKVCRKPDPNAPKQRKFSGEARVAWDQAITPRGYKSLDYCLL